MAILQPRAPKGRSGPDSPTRRRLSMRKARAHQFDWAPLAANAAFRT